MTGTVVALIPGGRFGFIEREHAPRAPHCFFHADDLRGLEYGPQLREQRVAFDTEDHPKGPRAVNIRAAD